MIAIAVLASIIFSALFVYSLALFNAENPQHPAVAHPEVAGKRVTYREEVVPPKPAYNFNLTDQSGVWVSLDSLKGKVLVVSFIYTGCPDVCSIAASIYLDIQKELRDHVGKDVVLVFITTDPARDTLEVMDAWTKGYGGKWLFLRGETAELEEVWRQYEIFVKPSGIIVYHSYKAYIIDRNNMIRFKYVGLFNPADAAQDIRNLLREG